MKLEPPILVVGIPRSGSSMTAGMLWTCGAWVGVVSRDCPERSTAFENLPVRDFITRPLLVSNGLSDTPQYNSLNRVMSDSCSVVLRRTVHSYMDSQGLAKDGVWLYKDARLALMWPVWERAFPDALWVLVRRDLGAIARSCVQTAYMKACDTFAEWYAWIERYEELLYEIEQSVDRSCMISPSKMLKGDFTESRRLVEGVGLQWNQEAVEKFLFGKEEHEDGESNSE